jgi:hypothetical protein
VSKAIHDTLISRASAVIGCSVQGTCPDWCEPAVRIDSIGISKRVENDISPGAIGARHKFKNDPFAICTAKARRAIDIARRVRQNGALWGLTVGVVATVDDFLSPVTAVLQSQFVNRADLVVPAIEAGPEEIAVGIKGHFTRGVLTIRRSAEAVQQGLGPGSA